MKTVKYMLCSGGLALAMTSPTVAVAQSFEEQMEVQSVLQDLDWQVQIREKQIEVERLTNELEAAKNGEEAEREKNQSGRNGQQSVFQYGRQQGAQQAMQEEQIPLTAEEIEQQRREAREQERRIEIMSAESDIDSMRLIEVYAPKGSDDLEAVVGIAGGLRTLIEGDKYNGWKVTEVNMQYLTFYHSGLDLTKSLRFIR